MAQLRAGMKVQGRTRTYANKYTMTGCPHENTYQGMGMSTTSKSLAIGVGREALHARGPWAQGGGGSGLHRGNLCHRLTKSGLLNLAKDHARGHLKNHAEAARIASLQMDRMSGKLYAHAIDLLDKHIVALHGGGQFGKDLLEELILKERDRGASHIRNSVEILFS